MQLDEPPAAWGRVRSASDLGRRVAAARQSHNLTQAELAGWLAVDRTTVLRLEAGKVGQIERVFDVLAVLGLDVVVVPRDARVVVEQAGQPQT